MKTISGFILLMCMSVVSTAETVIDVFSYTPITEVSIPSAQVYWHDLSRTAAIESAAPEFPYDPNNPAPTVAATKAWLQSDDGRRWNQAIRESYKPLEKLYQCGITKTPAIAFDRCRYVIYGLTDIRQAVQEYDDYIRKNGGAK